jgi:ubiquinone/menaquinone biosynthesis C-methylase UbiE
MGKIYIQQKKFWEDKKRTKRRHPNHPVVKAFVLSKINFIRENINLLKNSTLLDVGCGNGFFTYHLAKFYDVTGLDFSKRMLKINPHRKLVHGDVENLPFDNNSFDVVFCSDLLHHLKTPEKAVKEMKRVAKKYIIISEPNRNNPLSFLFHLIKKGERKALKFTKRYLNKICRKLNLNPIKSFTSGFIYPNKTPNIKILLSILKKLEFNQPFGNVITVIYKK